MTFSNHSLVFSSNIEGANGLKFSRRLIFKFIIFFMSRSHGLANIDLFPKALGPHSILFWYQPTILFSKISFAVLFTKIFSSSMYSTLIFSLFWYLLIFLSIKFLKLFTSRLVPKYGFE